MSYLTDHDDPDLYVLTDVDSYEESNEFLTDPLADDREGEKRYMEKFGKPLRAELSARGAHHIRTLNEIFRL